MTESSEARQQCSEDNNNKQLCRIPWKKLRMEIRHADELHELLSGPDIVRCIKFKRMQWVSHIV